MSKLFENGVQLSEKQAKRQGLPVKDDWQSPIVHGCTYGATRTQPRTKSFSASVAAAFQQIVNVRRDGWRTIKKIKEGLIEER